MHGQNLGSNFSMRAQTRAGSEWKKQKRLWWTFFSSRCNCVSLRAKPPIGAYSYQLEQLTRRQRSNEVKKLSSVSQHIAVINTAYLEANLSFAGKHWPTNNNQALLFPLETSNGLQMELMQTNDVTHNQLNHNKDPEA